MHMRKFSTCLIVIGIILLLIPTLGRLYINYNKDKLYKDYLEQQSNNTENDENENSTTNTQIIDEANDVDVVDIMDENFNNAITQIEEDSKKETLPKPKLNAIGSVQIPYLSIDLLLLEGSSQTKLLYGAGHLIGTSYPGEIGNCAIAGHRGYTFGSYFYRLDELKVGDIITINYNSNEYKYSVDESFIVLPTDVYILAQPKDKKILTLITCDPPIIGSHRLIIRATLIEDIE